MQLDDVWRLAEKIAASRLFPVANATEAFALMMLCQSKGLHPMTAVERYHIIEGRPSMRADAIQAEFQRLGGKIEIVRADAEEARAIFSHHTHQPKPIEQFVTLADFKASGLTNGKEGMKKNWRQSPGDMLWARLVTKTIRKIYPGIVAGIYSTEEVQDMADDAEPRTVQGQIQRQAETALALEQGPVYAGPQPGEIDRRDYKHVAADAVAKVTEELQGSSLSPPTLPELHRAIMTRAIMTGKYTGKRPEKVGQIVPILTELAKADPAFVRDEITKFCRTRVEFGATDPPAPATAPPPPPAEVIDVEPDDADALDSLYPAEEEPPEPSWDG
jgi:hypothetical protein